LLEHFASFCSAQYVVTLSLFFHVCLFEQTNDDDDDDDFAITYISAIASLVALTVRKSL